MENVKKLVLLSLFVFSVFSISITFWYMSIEFSANSDVSTIIKNFIQIGILAGVISVLIFLLVIFLFKKIKNPFLLTILIVLILILFLIISYWYVLNMIYYSLDQSQPFLIKFFRL